MGKTYNNVVIITQNDDLTINLTFFIFLPTSGIRVDVVPVVLRKSRVHNPS